MSTVLTPVVDAVAGARAVAAVAAQQADRSEHARRLATDVVDAIVAAGLGRLLAPRALGGEAALPAAVQSIETVAAADASAGWCLAVGIGSNYLSGFVPYSGAREVFSDLDRLGAGVFVPGGQATPHGDGYRLNGRWPFASGCQHAAVLALGVVVTDVDGNVPAPPRASVVVVPADQVIVHETWDTSGLRGTGSHHVVVHDVHVTTDQLMTFGQPGWADDPIFRVNPFTVLGPCLAAVPLGVGRAALDTAAAAARSEQAAPTPFRLKPALADDTAVQTRFGAAEVRLRAARALLVNAIDAVMAQVLDGTTTSRSSRALVGLACAEAMAAAEQAVDTACRVIGSAAAREGQPLERARRDLDTMRHHVLFSVPGPSLSRQLAGIPTQSFPFLLEPLD